MSKNPRKQAQRKRQFGSLEASNEPSTSGLGLISAQPSFSHEPSTSGDFGSLQPFSSTSFKDLSIDDDSTSLNKFKFALKKYGKMGKPTQLYVNFFKIDLSKEVNYFHYNIEIISDGQSSGKSAQQGPKKDSTPKSKKTPKRLNDEVFRAIFAQHRNVFQCNVLPVFDGNKNFYSTTQFRLPNGQWSGIITVIDKEREEKIRVNITTPEVSHGQNLRDLAKKTDQIMPVELQALDIIMRNGPRLTKISLGPNFFLKSGDERSKRLQFDIEGDILKYGQFGHYQCAKMTEGGLYYNVDRAMAIFTEGGKLIEIIKDILERNQIGNLDDRDKKKVEDQIKSLKFNALHLNYKRTFIIAGFSKNTIKNTLFNLEHDGQKRQISVYDYFQQEYKTFCQRYKLDPNLPCIQVGSRNNSKYFPIEVCELEWDEVYRRKLDLRQQGAVTRKSSQQSPIDRFKGIEDHVKTLNNDSTINGTNYLQHYGLSVKPNKTVIDARILDAPPLIYNNEKEINTNNAGQWDIRGFQFFKPAAIGSDWMIVNFHKIYNRENRPSINKAKVDGLVKSLIAESRNKGINMSTPRTTLYEFNYRGKNTLKNDLFDKYRGLKFMMLLIPTKDEIYNEIKAVAELEVGLITQCLNQEKKHWRDAHLSGQLLTNFLLKINPKCQGTNNSIRNSFRPPILRAKLMFIGLDVTHPSPTDGLSKSIAACVGSYTKHFDKCFHKIVIQEKARKEVVNLKEIVKELLQNFKSVNNFYPEKIIVYRDGIGEGDFAKILNVETDSVKRACEELGSPTTKVTYVMVQKRHNTRFLPVNANPRDKPAFQNVLPGTVVDRGITHHKFFEFYLTSHVGMMGTSRPCKYIVLFDENDLSADEIQAATYYTCYLYPRCTKASSIPPFVFYAHLLAKRGRSYMAHLEDSDGRSSVGSGNQQLSQAQINQLNRDVTVRPNINGILFFV